MLGTIKEFKIVSESHEKTVRPFLVKLELECFVTPRELELLQIAKLDNLKLTSIGCNKFQRQRNERRI
jgi:hypothetical protein